MSATSTRTGTHTSTYTSVVHITRKVQADMLAICDTYNYFTEKYAQDVIHDVRIFIDEEVIEWVQFVWKTPGTNRVIDALRYKVVNGGIGLADDRPGGIRYNPALDGADFRVRVQYNDRWSKLTDAGRKEVRSSLTLTWGVAGTLDYSGGQWTNDRTYSKDGSALVRSRFAGR